MATINWDVWSHGGCYENYSHVGHYTVLSRTTRPACGRLHGEISQKFDLNLKSPGFWASILCVFLISPCVLHVAPISSSIVWSPFCKLHKLWTTSKFSFLHTPANSSLFGSSTFLCVFVRKWVKGTDVGAIIYNRPRFRPRNYRVNLK